MAVIKPKSSLDEPSHCTSYLSTNESAAAVQLTRKEGKSVPSCATTVVSVAERLVGGATTNGFGNVLEPKDGCTASVDQVNIEDVCSRITTFTSPLSNNCKFVTMNFLLLQSGVEWVTVTTSPIAHFNASDVAVIPTISFEFLDSKHTILAISLAA